MKRKINLLKTSIAGAIVLVMLFSTIIPSVIADNTHILNKGFTKGVSYQPVVPMKRVTFVNFDENSLIDDYAYLAAVPTSVFYDKDGSRIFSNPLLFYQDEYPVEEDKDRSLNAHEGIDYFMEDWMSYCSGQLDKMTLINVPKDKLDSTWKAKDYTTVESDNPYDIANKIALDEWSYSDTAVIAGIEENFEKPETEYKGTAKGVIPSEFSVKHESFMMKEPEIGVGGNYQAFDIHEPYKYTVANMYWSNVAIDLDLQLYDDQLGMADASSKWNIFYGAGETVSSYVYDYGKWEIGITYMPTKSSLPDDGMMKSMFQNVNDQTGILSRLGLGKRSSDTETVNIDLYPGVELKLEDSTPFGCRNAEFKLKWNNPNVPLGFVVLDPSGAETASSPSDDEIINGVDKSVNERCINIEKLGETKEDERYSVCVFALDDVSIPVDFTIEYSWQQNFSRVEGDCIASATEGSVLASILNAPLLFVSESTVPKSTEAALYKLGVKNIYLVNLGDHISSDVTKKLGEIASVKKEFTEYKAIYDEIRTYTGRNDVIFSTIDPWTYYFAEGQTPAGEYPGALFIGPAAYIAAHHGSPVLLVDNHPELSQAIVWHTKFWRETANMIFRPMLPSVACMVLTGKNVMRFLESYGYNLPKDKENLETMITVADHFDIGATWDRTFTGALIPGRFCGTPVDTAYWISRDVFYPALIFENPALQGEIKLINGSKSVVKPLIGKLMNPKGTDLVITKPSQEEDFRYPILHTYNVYLYNFNRDASKHWGGMYTSANGITPYVTPSPYSIDVGATDKAGAYYPDMSETEVTPFYASKAGYSNCFSTNFEKTMENLNRGVIMWMESCHGSNGGYGGISTWNYESPYVNEENPWRAYERPLISLGSINEFIKYFPELYKGRAPRVLLFLARVLTKPLDLVFVDKGSTEDPDVVVMNPEVKPSILSDAFGVDLHIKESHGLSLLPIIGRKYRTSADGVVIDPLIGGENVLKGVNGIKIDDNLSNLHSCGLNAVSCLVAHTYLHLALIRHGTAYQIMDPWSTSWYSGIWLHSIPRHLALGNTMGQAYEQGMAEVGVEYLVDQWWWDLNENVVFYGDPDIRVWTPSTEWDPESRNNWEKNDVQSLRYDAETSIDGHMPFGVTSYPHEKTPLTFWQQYMWIILALVIIVILVLVAVSMGKRKR